MKAICNLLLLASILVFFGCGVDDELTEVTYPIVFEFDGKSYYAETVIDVKTNEPLTGILCYQEPIPQEALKQFGDTSYKTPKYPLKARNSLQGKECTYEMNALELVYYDFTLDAFTSLGSYKNSANIENQLIEGLKTNRAKETKLTTPEAAPPAS